MWPLCPPSFYLQGLELSRTRRSVWLHCLYALHQNADLVVLGYIFILAHALKYWTHILRSFSEPSHTQLTLIVAQLQAEVSAKIQLYFDEQQWCYGLLNQQDRWAVKPRIILYKLNFNPVMIKWAVFGVEAKIRQWYCDWWWIILWKWRGDILTWVRKIIGRSSSNDYRPPSALIWPCSCI